MAKDDTDLLDDIFSERGQKEELVYASKPVNKISMALEKAEVQYRSDNEYRRWLEETRSALLRKARDGEMKKNPVQGITPTEFFLEENLPRSMQSWTAALGIEKNIRSRQDVFDHYSPFCMEGDVADLVGLVQMAQHNYNVPMIEAKPSDVVYYLVLNEELQRLRAEKTQKETELKGLQDGLAGTVADSVLDHFSRYTTRSPEMGKKWKETKAKVAGNPMNVVKEVTEFLGFYSSAVQADMKKQEKDSRSTIRKRRRNEYLRRILDEIGIDFRADRGAKPADLREKIGAIIDKALAPEKDLTFVPVDKKNYKPKRGDEITVIADTAFDKHGIPIGTTGTIERVEDGKIYLKDRKNYLRENEIEPASRTKFRVGDEVKIVKAMRHDNKYYYGGNTAQTPLGSTGTISSIPDMEKISVDVKRYGMWKVHPDEIQKISGRTNVIEKLLDMFSSDGIKKGDEIEIVKYSGGNHYCYGGTVRKVPFGVKGVVEIVEGDRILVKLPEQYSGMEINDERRYGLMNLLTSEVRKTHISNIDRGLIEAAKQEMEILEDAKQKKMSPDFLYELYDSKPGSLEKLKKQLPYAMLKSAHPSAAEVKEEAKTAALNLVKEVYPFPFENEANYVITGNTERITSSFYNDCFARSKRSITSVSEEIRDRDFLITRIQRYTDSFN